MSARELISPALRARITRQVIHAPAHRWSGRRQGVSLTFRLADQANLEQHPFEWAACYRRRRFAGTAPTIFDAVWEVTAQIAKQKGAHDAQPHERRRNSEADASRAGRPSGPDHLPGLRERETQARLPGL